MSVATPPTATAAPAASRTGNFDTMLMRSPLAESVASSNCSGTPRASTSASVCAKRAACSGVKTSASAWPSTCPARSPKRCRNCGLTKR
jgi:hypothetical protein